LNEYIESLGYPYENHEYMTEDGYINSIIRIPGKDFEEAPKAKKPVVIYQHGLMDSCASIIADG